jgi:hypothetical protein
MALGIDQRGRNIEMRSDSTTVFTGVTDLGGVTETDIEATTVTLGPAQDDESSGDHSQPDGGITLLGADLSLDFQTAHAVEPGTVMVAVGRDQVDESRGATDRRVIGVVSGAGDSKSALRLGSRPDVDTVPVALVGRVYCKADASEGPIGVGDLLTTARRPGHAARVNDRAAAAGAVLGKALGTLSHGSGLIPVLLMLG